MTDISMGELIRRTTANRSLSHARIKSRENGDLIGAAIETITEMRVNLDRLLADLETAHKNSREITEIQTKCIERQV